MQLSNLCIFWLSLSLTAADELSNSTNFGECTTPKKESGECIYLENCQYLYDLLQSSGLRDEDKTLLRQSHCGFNNKKVLVCCSKNVETTTMITDVGNFTNFGECTTPKQESGQCIHLEECKSLYNLLQAGELRDEEKLFLKRSHCGFRNKKILICCPKKVETSNERIGIRGARLLPKPGACGNVLSNRILNGIVTKIDEFPWMALLEFTDENGAKRHNCGGSLINNRYIVTAAHCLSGDFNMEVTGVRLGEWDTTTEIDCEVDAKGAKDCAPPHVDVAIEKKIIHPDFSLRKRRHKGNDIALLRLAKGVTYTDFIRPICLPLDPKLRQLNVEGVAMDVSGWGVTEVFSANVSNWKLKATVPVTSKEECRQFFKDDVEIDETQLCAGGKEGKDSCRGDSGGPLIGLDTTSRVRVYYYLAGIVSFGLSCGTEYPSVYTNVSHFIEWIEDNIEP